MSDIAEQYDYWNQETGISISKLETMKVIAKPTKKSEEVNVGQLFTAIACMTTQNDEDIEVCVTGYLRGVMSQNNPRPWEAKDCFAPRNHHNGVPPVRLLKYPRNLRTESGDRLLTIDLSKRITDQLAEDNGWRDQICRKVGAVSMEAIYASLGIELPKPAEPEPEVTDETDSDDEFNLDSFELDEADTSDDQPSLDSEPEVAQKNDDPDEAEAVGLDSVSDDDDDDMASLVDDWDEENGDDDLSALEGQSRTDEAMESLSNLDDDSDLSEHTPRENEQSSQVGRAESVAEKRDQTAESERDSAAPALTETKQPAARENKTPSVRNIRPFVRQDSAPVAQPQKAVTSPAPIAAERSDNSASEERPVHREHVLFNADGYDVGFMGLEHGEVALKDDSGAMGTLFTTRGGLIVVHVDGMKVLEFKEENKDELYDICGYDRDAKKVYASAKVPCVRWLE